MSGVANKSSPALRCRCHIADLKILKCLVSQRSFFVCLVSDFLRILTWDASPFFTEYFWTFFQKQIQAKII